MKYIVDIKGEIEGDYEIIGKYEERPQGEWIKTNELIGEHFHNVFVCNQCGARAVDKLKFCPECGADMRGAK